MRLQYKHASVRHGPMVRTFRYVEDEAHSFRSRGKVSISVKKQVWRSMGTIKVALIYHYGLGIHST